MTDRLDVIAAFADGEPVAAADLGAALAHDDARSYLIDVLALRGLVTDAKPYAAVVSGLPPSRTLRRTGQPAAQRQRWSSLRVVAAAAVVVVGMAAGFTAGRRTAGTDAGQGREVSEAREGKAVVTAPAAPAPTHVFRMENGVNWNERTGGN